MAGGIALPKRRSIDYIALALFLFLLINGLLWGVPIPGTHDPSLLNGRTVELIGRLPHGFSRWRVPNVVVCLRPLCSVEPKFNFRLSCAKPSVLLAYRTP